jgi:hypothetical protein
MKNFVSRRIAVIGCAFVALTVVGLVPATASAQQTSGTWTCRGTGLRIGAFEAGVSNAPNAPCRSQVAFPVNLRLPLGALLDLQVLALGSATDASRGGGGFGNGVSSQAGAAGVTLRLLGLSLQTGVVRNIGFVTCAANPNSPTGMSPAFNGPNKNQTLGLRINNGQELQVNGPLVLPLGIITLKLNQTTQAQNAQGGFLLQRAVEINSPILPTVVVGESLVDYAGNPCTG